MNQLVMRSGLFVRNYASACIQIRNKKSCDVPYLSLIVMILPCDNCDVNGIITCYQINQS